MISDLPTEVLRDIFNRCEPASLAATSRQFAAIVYSTRPLWSSVQLRPAHFVPQGSTYIRRRLQRAGVMPLEVSMVPIGSATDTSVINEVCATLSEFNSRIRRLEITAETSLSAGTILSGVFPSTVAIFPNLEVLSIRVENEPAGVHLFSWPHLDVVLERAVGWFPALQVLAITTFDDCIPIFPELSSFAQLRTLILDGSLEQGEAFIGSIVSVLYSTPRLETLWLKHFSREQSINVAGPVLPARIRDREIRIPVLLPYLTSLSIAAPGCGVDIIYCIRAPALCQLHMDGTRGPIYGETERAAFTWSDWDTSSVQNALKHLALQSRCLRRLAVTSTYLTHAGWRWLLFGEEAGPPFPRLEHLALHGLDDHSGRIACGFDDDLLLQYAQEPLVSLLRLVLIRCSFPLSGSALVQAFKGTRMRARTEPLGLEFDQGCPHITEDEWNTLSSAGVELICRRGEEVEEDEWWTRVHQIEGSDSHVY